MEITSTYIIAFLGGFIPATLWLTFWMSEDKKNPEPKQIIALAFCAGILSVPLALFFQKAFNTGFVHPYPLTEFLTQFPIKGTLALVVFAAIEEIAKFLVVFAAVLWRKEVDEPIDYIIYCIVAALGFAAYETALFIFTPISNGALAEAIITSNIRAVGAMLLHVVASAAIGLSLAFAFFRSWRIRFLYGTLGIVVATILHSAFNIAIIRNSGEHVTIAFVSVWAAIVILLVFFERAKKIHPTYKH